MPFINFNSDDSKRKETSFAKQSALRLYTILKSRRKMFRKLNVATWTTEFENLLSSTSEDRITRALNWYEDNVGNENVPKAYSAKSFRIHFIRIEKRMIEKGVSTGEVELSPLSRKITARVSTKFWPLGCRDEVPLLIEQSVLFHSQFVKAFQKVEMRMRDKRPSKKDELFRRRMIRFIYYIKGRYILHHTFVERYVLEVQKRLQGWKSWTGSLLSYSMDIDQQTFRFIGRSFAADWGIPSLWDTLMALVRKELK